MIPLSLNDVERTFAKLWEATSRKQARVSTFTLVAFCATPDELPRARGALLPLAASHPCRTLSVTCYPGEQPSITARAGLHVDTTRDNEPIGEDIDLDVRGGARDWIPTTLARLRRSDVPLYVWWVGDLPDNDRLFDHLLEYADVAVVHTADMDLRDLEALARMIAMSNGVYVITDLTWARLGAWQEFTARFFDDPAVRAHLPAVRSLSVSLTPGVRGPEVASTQAALFVGWFTSVLGWNTKSPTWKLDGSVATATLTDARGEGVTVRFETVEQADVYPGAIHQVVLEGEGLRFEVTRSPDDALVLCWSGECPGAVIPKQCVRIGTPDEPKMLARTLDRPRRDPLFERSLAAAARLVESVAARPT